MAEVKQVHILDFKSEIKNVIKLENGAMVICLGLDLMICNPFVQNRPLGGMHSKTFKNSVPILGACSMKITSELAYDFFQTEYRHPFKIQDGIVIFDSDQNFTVIDLVHNLAIIKFKYLGPEVDDICSTPHSPCQLAVLTESEIQILQISLNSYSVLQTIDIQGKAISPFMEGYLVDTQHSLRFIKNGTEQMKQYAAHIPFADFRVDNDRVVIASCSANSREDVIFKVTGGGSFTSRILVEELKWDVAGGYIFVLNDSSHITMASIEDVTKNCTITLPEKFPKVEELFAGLDRFQKNVIVMLFSKEQATTVQMPLSLFSQTEEDNDEPQE